MSDQSKLEDAPDDRPDVYQGFANSAHKDGQEPDGDSPLPAPATQSSVRQGQVGAPPIHWGWWGIGLVFSLALWWLIAALSGWI